MKPLPLVSIVISNHNGKDSLKECLESLYRQSYRRHEVIVVDCGSTDGTPQMVKAFFPKVKLIEVRTRIGIGEALNKGLRKAEGEYIIYDVNNDEVVAENWLENILKGFEVSPNVGVVGGKRYFYGTDNVIEFAGGKISYLTGMTWMAGYREEDNADMNIPKVVDFVVTPGIRRQLLSDVGFCDEKYEIYFEDTDYCLRAKRKGYEVIFMPSAVSWHKQSATIGRFSFRKYYYLCRNKLRFCLKNFPFPFMLTAFFIEGIFLTFVFGASLVLPLKRMLKNTRPASLLPIFTPAFLQARIKALFWNIRNLNETIRARACTAKLET